MPRGDQISRHWKILRLLERRKDGMTIAELHEQLDTDVDERTIQRDLEHLQQAFLFTKEGHRWILADQPIRSLPLSSTELLALLVLESLLEPLEASDVGDALRSLREKVSLSLPPKCAAFAAEAPYFASQRLPARAAEGRVIEDAIHKQQRLQLRYWSPSSGLQDRRVDPYSLWLADGRLYLVAWCHLRSAYRTFHVGRIQSAALLDEDFDRDPSFDMRRFAGGFGVWQSEEHEIALFFARAVAHVPRERLLHATQQLVELSDGSVLLTMRATGLPELAAWLAGFGGLVEVKRPQILADMVMRLHQDGLARHAATGTRSLDLTSRSCPSARRSRKSP